MSATMILGRVVLPGIGLVLAATVSFQVVRNVTARSTDGPAEAYRAGRGQRSDSGERLSAEGRVVAYPGGEVTVGTEVLATIVRMPAKVKAAVKKGDLLVELRDDEVRASLREARAQLVAAEAELRFEQERVRLDRLLPVIVGRSDLRPSGTRHEISVAQAKRDSAKAEVERLEAESARYRILAPIDGMVVFAHADVGETVPAAAPLVTIADLTRLRVEAEIDEYDIGRVALGAEATISAEGYRGRQWRGQVEEVSDVVVGRQTRPEDPARPTDTHVLPVKIGIRERHPLKLGQRVEVEVLAPDRRR
jgi:HlyD family secretion protein